MDLEMLALCFTELEYTLNVIWCVDSTLLLKLLCATLKKKSINKMMMLINLGFRVNFSR